MGKIKVLYMGSKLLFNILYSIQYFCARFSILELLAKKEMANLFPRLTKLYINAELVNAFLFYFPSPFDSKQVVGILDGNASMGHRVTVDLEVKACWLLRKTSKLIQNKFAYILMLIAFICQN